MIYGTAIALIFLSLLVMATIATAYAAYRMLKQPGPAGVDWYHPVVPIALWFLCWGYTYVLGLSFASC